MITGRIGRIGAAGALVASGTYFFVYLYRWEWNRAVIAGIVFVAAEIGLGTALILDRLRALRADAPAVPVVPAPAARPRSPEAPPPDRFAWLAPRRDEAGVFVPVLLGMGVVVSALAALVERLARRTAQPALERGLASRLASLSWPDAGLQPARDDPLALLTRPRAGP